VRGVEVLDGADSSLREPAPLVKRVVTSGADPGENGASGAPRLTGGRAGPFV